jgi:hypothetical protein
MKFLIAVILFSAPAFAIPIKPYPTCYQGTLVTNGNTVPFFLTFDTVTSDAIRVKELKIGEENYVAGGALDGENVTLNSNDDYAPGGNASFNIDISLNFHGKEVVGEDRYYQFKDGKGGFGQSKDQDLRSLGTIELKECRVKIIDY